MPLMVGFSMKTEQLRERGFTDTETDMLSSLMMGFLAGQCGLQSIRETDRFYEAWDTASGCLHAEIAAFRFTHLMSAGGGTYWYDCLHNGTDITARCAKTLINHLQDEAYLDRLRDARWFTNNSGKTPREFAMSCYRRACERSASDRDLLYLIEKQRKLWVVKTLRDKLSYDVMQKVGECMNDAVKQNQKKLLAEKRLSEGINSWECIYESELELRKKIEHRINEEGGALKKQRC